MKPVAPRVEPAHMTDAIHRRREIDRAEQRAARAADRGDHAGYLMARGQIDAAQRRRDEWAKRQSGTA